jgi:hypothetical protein
MKIGMRPSFPLSGLRGGKGVLPSEVSATPPSNLKVEAIGQLFSITPSTGAAVTPLVVSPTANAVRFFAPYDYTNPAYYDLLVSLDGGTTVETHRCYVYQGRYIILPSGSNVTVGCDGRILTGHFVKLALDSVPSIGANPVTASIDINVAGVPLWSPSASHIQFSPTSERIFSIAGDTVERTVFISEYDGAMWTPPRFVILQPGRSTTVICSYRNVALACYDTLTVAVTAPTGATLTSDTAGMSLPSVPFTGVSRVCNNTTEFLSACAAALAGDEIVLNAGTYTLGSILTVSAFTANNAAGRLGMEGITLRGATGNKADVVIVGILNFINENASTQLAAIKDLTINSTDLAVGTSAGSLHFRCGKWSVTNIRVTGIVTTSTALVALTATGTRNLIVRFLDCEVDNGAEDLIDGNGANSGNIIEIIRCVGKRPANVASSQCITMHFGMHADIWGGLYTDSTAAHIDHDQHTSWCNAWFVTVTQGIGTGVAQILKTNAFGCTAALAPGVNIAGYKSWSVFNRLSGGNVYRESIPNVWIAHNFLKPLTGIGIRAFFNSVGGKKITYNIFENYNEAVLLGFYVSGATEVTEVVGNTVKSGNPAIFFQTGSLPGLLKNNAAAGNAVSLRIDGAGWVTGSHNTFDPTVSANYPAGTNDVLNADAELDSFLFPVPGGNCDGTGTNHLNMLGLSDPWGYPLIYGLNRLSKGAREIPAIYANSRIYPDFL